MKPVVGLEPTTGQLHSNMTLLITFSHPDAERGYSVARLDTDVVWLEELRAIAQVN